FFEAGTFRRGTARGFGVGFVFGFGRATTSTCSSGIGTAAIAAFERALPCASAPAGSIAIDGAASDAKITRTSGWARRNLLVCIFWNGLEDGRLRGSLGRTPTRFVHQEHQ